jgi:hypothetical protein
MQRNAEFGLFSKPSIGFAILFNNFHQDFRRAHDPAVSVYTRMFCVSFGKDLFTVLAEYAIIELKHSLDIGVKGSFYEQYIVVLGRGVEFTVNLG